jgi:hypothetical protein
MANVALTAQPRAEEDDMKTAIMHKVGSAVRYEKKSLSDWLHGKLKAWESDPERKKRLEMARRLSGRLVTGGWKTRESLARSRIRMDSGSEALLGKE